MGILLPFFANYLVQKLSSVKSQFSLHFIKTGVFGKKYGQLLSEFFDWRQKGDYKNIFNYNHSLFSRSSSL